MGGFVASMNRTLTRYYSRPTRQHSHMELADGLKTCMMAALKEWKDKNDNQFPEKIIFYRDGVGDGQLEAVSKHELGQIMAAFRVSVILYLSEPQSARSFHYCSSVRPFVDFPHWFVLLFFCYCPPEVRNSGLIIRK